MTGLGMGRLARLGWGLALLHLSTVSAWPAKNEGETKELSIVLLSVEPNHFFRWEHWVEATVWIRNRGPAVDDARIVAQFATDREAVKVLFSRPVGIPANSSQQVKLLLRFPPETARPPGKTVGFPIQTRVMRDKVVLAEETFLAMPVPEGTLSVLWCDAGGDSLGYQLKKSGRADESPPAQPPGSKRAKARPATARAAPVPAAAVDGRNRPVFSALALCAKMPRHMAGYDPYDVVILSRWDANGLDALQTAALLNWVRAGGRLIALAGRHWIEHPNGELARALPLWPMERYPVSVLPGIEAAMGDLGIADGIGVMDGPRARSEILLGNEDQPILLRRPFGMGQVYFLALDIDRQREVYATGILRLFERMLVLTDEHPAHETWFPTTIARPILEQLVALRIMPRERMALWLGAYFTLVTVALMGARLTRRPEWGYGAAVVVIVGFFLLFQWQSRAERRKSTGQIEQVQVYIAEIMASSPDVHVRGIEGFFPEAGRNVNVRPDLFEARLFYVPGFGSEAVQVIEVETRDRVGIGAWQIPASALRAVNFDAVLEKSPGTVQYTGRLTRDGLLLECGSSLPWALRHCFLRWQRLVMPLPDLEKNKSWHVETWKQTGRQGRYEEDAVRGGRALARGLLRQAIFPDLPRVWGGPGSAQRIIQAAQGRRARPVVIGGFCEESVAPIKDSHGVPAQLPLGLWLVHGGGNPLTADPEFLMPAGLAELEIPGKGSMLAHLGDGNFGSPFGGEFIVKFKLPVCLRDATIEELTLHGRFESLHFAIDAQVAYGSPESEPVHWTAVPWDSQRWLDHPSGTGGGGDGAVWVKVNVKRKGAPPQPSDSDMVLPIQNWSLNGLDVSLRGKTGPAGTPNLDQRHD